jgi:hypothetical protein
VFRLLAIRPPRRAILPVVGLVAVTALALAGCSSSGSKSAADTSTVVAGPSTTGPPTPPSVPISIPTATDGTSPDGSGCTPPEGQQHLPNGIWFGVLKTVDPTGATIGLDLACWFSGTSAQAVTGATGPVDDDHYVRNQNPKIYTLPTVANVAVVPLAQAANGEFTGGPGAAASGFAAAQALLTDQSNHDVWVEITDGRVTVIQAQFSP